MVGDSGEWTKMVLLLVGVRDGDPVEETMGVLIIVWVHSPIRGCIGLGAFFVVSTLFDRNFFIRCPIDPIFFALRSSLGLLSYHENYPLIWLRLLVWNLPSN